jgi:hypothetical protein
MLGCRRGRGGRERPTRWNLAAKMLTWRWLAQRVQHLWELDRLCVGSIGFRCIISWELHSLPVLLTDLRVFVAAQAAFASSSAFHSGSITTEGLKRTRELLAARTSNRRRGAGQHAEEEKGALGLAAAQACPAGTSGGHALPHARMHAAPGGGTACRLPPPVPQPARLCAVPRASCHPTACPDMPAACLPRLSPRPAPAACCREPLAMRCST